MRVIVTGSPHITSFTTVVKAIRGAEKAWGEEVTEVVSGTSRGPDRLAEDWARWTKTKIKRFFPNWKRDGTGATRARNGKMVAYADSLVAVWDGKRGNTEDVIIEAKRIGLNNIYVERICN